MECARACSKFKPNERLDGLSAKKARRHLQQRVRHVSGYHAASTLLQTARAHIEGQSQCVKACDRCSLALHSRTQHKAMSSAGIAEDDRQCACVSRCESEYVVQGSPSNPVQQQGWCRCTVWLAPPRSIVHRKAAGQSRSLFGWARPGLSSVLNVAVPDKLFACPSTSRG